MSGIMGGGGAGATSTSEPRLGSLRVQTSQYGATLPVAYGRTRITGNVGWYGDFVAIATTTTTAVGGKGGGGGGATQSQTTYTYEAAIILILGEGVIAPAYAGWRGKKKFDNIAAMGLDAKTGLRGQSVWSHLTSKHPSQAIGYSDMAYVYAANYALNSNAETEPHSFEVQGQFAFQAGTIDDALPGAVIADVLTNPLYGASFPAAKLAALTNYNTYCQAAGLFVSPAYTAQESARDVLAALAAISNSAFYWSEGTLKIKSYADHPITGFGTTYTPDTAPVYDLTDDDFLPADGGPVKVSRKPNADTYNKIQIEYNDRANEYNTAIVDAQDQAHIEEFGLRVKDPIKMTAICDTATAKQVAQLLLQRNIGVRNTYEFRLGWKFCLLEPMDLVTITDLALGLDKTVIRITAVEEDEGGAISITAEDFPQGSATATTYPHQSGIGYSVNYNVAAPNISVPVFFEPPIALTTTGLEVWCAVSGQNPDWGGCHVWTSLDGSTYKKTGTVHGGARYGTTTSAMPSAGGTVGVSLAGLGGQMLPGTALEAAAYQTLSWVGNASGGEFFAYQDATLVTSNTYTLAGLVRGAYEGNSVAHSTGSSFVRIDSAITKSDPLDLDMVGKTLHFKFTSFNVYGGGEQVISDVTDYTYTITGAMAQLPPSDVAGFQSSITGNGILLSWTKPADADYALTEIRYGADWATGTVVTRKASMTHLVAWQTAATHKYWARHEDKLGNQSATATSTSITIRAPNQVQMVTTEMQANALVMQWLDAKSDQPILRYEYFYGDAGAALSACVSWGSAGSDGRSDVRYFRTPGLKQIYVLAYDLAGNASTPVAFTVTSTMPTDFVIATDRYEDWQTSETTNTTIVGGANGQLLMPVADQTWGAHFSTRGWANAQAQVSAGYPLYWQPAAASGSHIERLDCGRLIAGGVINVGVTAQNLGTGAVGTVSIRTSSDATTWSAWVDSVSLQAPSFRYVETRYAVTSGGVGAILIDDIHVTVQLQTLTELANLTLVASDTLGTFYTTTKPFIDIQNVQVTPLNSPSIYRLNPVIKDDVAPFGVYVQAWDASNTRVSGTVSLSISGV